MEITRAIPPSSSASPRCSRGTLTIDYRAIVANDVVDGQILRNTAVHRSDTIPGNDSNQRVFISSASAELNVAEPTLVKTVTATDLGDTGSSQGNPALTDLAFGEAVTFTVTATMPEGTALSVILTDQLPIGTGLIEVSSASIASIGGHLSIGSGAGVGTLAILTDRDGDGRADTATFTLGNIINAADGVVDANDQISFTVTGRLISTPTTAAGTISTNHAEMSFTTPSG